MKRCSQSGPHTIPTWNKSTQAEANMAGSILLISATHAHQQMVSSGRQKDWGLCEPHPKQKVSKTFHDLQGSTCMAHFIYWGGLS